MAVAKFLNLLAISSLAIVACSFGSSPVNAVSIEGHHVARHISHGHEAIARRKRASPSKRCKARPHKADVPQPASPDAKAVESKPPAKASGKVTASGEVDVQPSQPKAPAPAPPKAEAPPAPAPAPPKVAAPPKPSAPPSNPPPSPPPSTGSSGGGKAGLAWPNGDDPSLSNFKRPKVSQLYTWSPYIPDKARQLGFNVIPMLWGENQVSDFKRLVVKGYANTVLGFNEPNQQGQSDMSPQRGAQLWQQYIQPLKYQGYKLVSPATTSAPSGKTWMKDFFNACQGCTVDAVAIHYYDVTAEGFIKYITDFHDTFGKPIWATEFACQNFNGGPQCSRDQVFSFMGQITHFMDNTDWVEHYFPFGVMHDMQGVNSLNQLMDGSGRPTDLAYAYFG